MNKSKRTISAEFKAKIANKVIKENKTLSEHAQIYQVHPNLITHWKRDFLANAGKVFDSEKDESSEIKKLKKEKEVWVHQIDRLSVDIKWLKKGSILPLFICREG